VCAELHCNMCKEIGGKLYNRQLYGHVQKLVRQCYRIVGPTVQTDRTVSDNKPDNIMSDHKQGPAFQ
jgi:hypothetical protein